jgi:hypothetical protein
MECCGQLIINMNNLPFEVVDCFECGKGYKRRVKRKTAAGKSILRRPNSVTCSKPCSASWNRKTEKQKENAQQELQKRSGQREEDSKRANASKEV